MIRPISEKNCGLFLDYVFKSVEIEFIGNSYIEISAHGSFESFPIHNVSCSIDEKGKCWKTFTMRGRKMLNENCTKFIRPKLKVSVCLSHNRTIKVEIIG